jgi:hypothetical protein
LDLLHPRPEDEKRKHKLKRLVQHPNSYFMDVKCPGKTEAKRAWSLICNEKTQLLSLRKTAMQL